MTLKDNWDTGDTYNADDMNALTTQVNENTATLTDTGLAGAGSPIEAKEAINADYYVNAKDFGAVGNGDDAEPADDTLALQAWLDYLVANHRQGWLPNGIYKITATLVAQAGYGWGIVGESANYTQIMQFTDNVAILQLGTTSGSSHSISLDNIVFIYNTAQPSTNTGANCLDFRNPTAMAGSFYYSQFTRLQFWQGYYGIKFLSNSYTPWGCVWDQLYMKAMSGGMLDQTGGLSSAANNRWGRVTMHCVGAVGPIFKYWTLYNSTIDCLEFVAANQGPQLITTGNAFSADIGSIKLEIGTYTGAGKALIDFSGDYRVRLGSLQVGPGTFTPSSGILSVITVGGGASASDSFLDINSVFLAAGSGSVSGQAVAVNGGGEPARRININSAYLTDGWTLQSTGSSTTGDYVTVRAWVNNTLSGDKGDANYTVTLGEPNVVNFNTTFTAQRTITLPASSSNNNCAGLYYDLIFSGSINGANTAVIKHGATTLRTQTTDNVRLRYAWRRQGSGSGSWVLVDLNDISGTAMMSLGGADSNILSQSLRANRNINGGGTITVASNSVLWSTQYQILSNGRSTAFCPDGFWNVGCPVSGTVTGVGGAVNKTATAAGVPLAAGEALYYILPLTSGQSTVAANFRVVSYASNVEVPHHWVMICARSGAGVFNFPNGINLQSGESFNTSGLVSQRVAVPASAAAAGTAGQWAADASWIYVCTATNTWVRGALATW